MKIGLLLTKDTLRARAIFEYFEQGAQSHGDTCVWVDSHERYKQQLEGCDVGVQVCYPNKHHGGSAQGRFRIDVNEFLFKRSHRVLTIDTGFVKNQSEYELEIAKANGKHKVLFDLDNVDTYKGVMKTIYYEVGYDGLKGNADYCVDDSTPDDRWRRLDTPLRRWRKNGEHILLIGQTVNGLSSQDVNIYDWYRETIKAIRSRTQRPILFRHHPRVSKIREHGSRIGKDVQALEKAIGKVSNFKRSDPSLFLIEEELRHCWAAVSYTSNAAVAAILAGIPVIAGHKSNMTWPVAGHSLAAIESPPTPERQPWANRLAYSQYNCEEMRNGTCWAHFRPHAGKPPRPAYEWR